MYKKCKVVMIATDEKVESYIYLTPKNQLFVNIRNTVPKDVFFNPQHLYILSDDEIKKGDYSQTFKAVPNREMVIHHCIDNGDVESANSLECPKVIASTDTSLHAIKFRGTKLEAPSKCLRGIAVIPQSFIDLYVSEYNKGNKIEEVMVEHFRPNEAYQISEHWSIKVNSDNTINIKSIKDIWTREEVIEIIERLAFLDICVFDKSGMYTDEYKQWIKSNL